MKAICPYCKELHSGPFPKMVSATHLCYDVKYNLDPLVEGKQRFNKKQPTLSLEDRVDEVAGAIQPKKFSSKKELRDL